MQLLGDSLLFVATWKPFAQLRIHQLQYVLHYTIMLKYNDKHHYESDKNGRKSDKILGIIEVSSLSKKHS